MDNQENIIISKYINGELTGEELVAFEKLLQKDEVLNDEVNFHKVVDETLAENYQAINSIDESERLEFEGILSKVVDGEKIVEVPATTQTSIIRKLWPLAALAAAATLLLFLIPGLKKDNAALADNFYKPYTYKAEPTLNNNLKEGITIYQNEDYKTALAIFNNNLNGDLKLYLMKGNAEYNLEKYDAAIKSFNFVVDKTGNQNFKNYANWYLALTYLKKENKEKAVQFLKALPEHADYYTQAKALLKKL